MFCPGRCPIVVFSGFYLALRSPCWGRGSELWLCFALVCGLCTVSLGLFALLLGVNGGLTLPFSVLFLLWSSSLVTILGYFSYYFIKTYVVGAH